MDLKSVVAPLDRRNLFFMEEKTVYLTVKDHSVSGEEFELRHNSKWDMLETFPQPTKSELPRYYKSEDYISHTDSSRNLFEKTYQLVRDISLKRKLKLINSFGTEEKKLLDVGCGTGDFLNVALNNDWSVTGVEPDERARAIANGKAKGKVHDIVDLPGFDRHAFDVITLWHVLEHLPDLEDHIAMFKKLLKPSGRLIIAVPNYKSHDARHYKEFWAAYDVPRHLWHFSQTAIKELFGKSNLVIENILPMRFDAYYVSLLSEKYKSGWMNIFKAFAVGAVSNFNAKRTKEYSSLIYVLKNT